MVPERDGYIFSVNPLPVLGATWITHSAHPVLRRERGERETAGVITEYKSERGLAEKEKLRGRRVTEKQRSRRRRRRRKKGVTNG